jgi:peptide/nickel transport system substrate-binding protein
MAREGYWSSATGRRFSRRAGLRAAGIGTAGLAAWMAACSSGNNNNNQNKPNSAATRGTAPSATSAGASPVAGGGGATATRAATAAAPSPAAANVKTGGTFQYAATNATGLDVMKNSGGPLWLNVSFSLSRLVKFQTGLDESPAIGTTFTPDKWFSLAPDVTSGWENPDTQTYVFTVRPEAKWHNVDPVNGRKVTADDVVYGWQYYTTARADKGAAIASLVDSVQATAPDKVQFKLKQTFAPFLASLAQPTDFDLYPKELITADGDANKRMVGSGPFIFESFQRDVAFKWHKNPDYWMKDAAGRAMPYLDRWESSIIADVNTRLTQFQAGNLHMVSVPTTLVDQFQGQNTNAKFQSSSASALTKLFFPPGTFDQDLKPFNDVRVRRALSMAVDRDALIKLASAGKGGVWNNILPSGQRWYLDPKSSAMGPAAQWYKYDPEGAKSLLKQAGYDDLPIDLYYIADEYLSTVPYYNPIGEALPAMLKKANFTVTAKPVPYQAQWINPQTGIFYGKLPPNSIAWGLEIGYSEPDGFLYNMLAPDGAVNNPGHSRITVPALVTLVQQQRAEIDETKRRALVEEIQRQGSDQMVFVPMIGPLSFSARQGFVRNLYGPSQYGFGVETAPFLWLDK